MGPRVRSNGGGATSATRPCAPPPSGPQEAEYEQLLETEVMSPKMQASVVSKLDEARRQQQAALKPAQQRFPAASSGLDVWQQEALAARPKPTADAMWPLLLVVLMVCQHVVATSSSGPHALLGPAGESLLLRLARFGLM